MKGVTLRLLLDEQGLRSQRRRRQCQANRERAPAHRAAPASPGTRAPAATICRGNATRSAVSRVGLGNHAAADPGRDRDSVLRALHASVSPTCARWPTRRVDEVLHLWTGLGYYARARNLHRAAQLIRDQHGGEFPRELDAVDGAAGHRSLDRRRHPRAVPGARHPILDGNVKRVLARHYAHRRRARRQRDAGAALATRRSRTRRPPTWRPTRRPSWISARRCVRAQTALRRVPDRRRLPRAHRRTPGRTAGREARARARAGRSAP